jgi:isopenicillin N synthase-like dioxygenase
MMAPSHSRLAALHGHLQGRHHRIHNGLAADPAAEALWMPPVVDVGALLDPSSASPAARSAALEAIDGAFRHGSGAFIAVGHGLNKPLRSVLGGSQEFFDAPHELQEPHREGKHFTPVGAAKIAVRPSTLHERLSYPRVCYEDEDVAASEVVGTSNGVAANLDQDSPHLFDTFPGLDESFREYQHGLRRLVRALLGGVAELLEIDEDTLENGWRHTSSGITCLHYPQVEERPETDGLAAMGNDPREYNGAIGEQLTTGSSNIGTDFLPVSSGAVEGKQSDLGATMRAYPHADGDTMFTILGHDHAEGLELLVRGTTVQDDQWIGVPHIEGGLVVQLGQMMQRMTNDVYLATPHRVVMPPSGVVPQRMSVVMFYRPGLQTVIEPPASLAATHKNALGTVYEPVTVSEFLQMPRSDEEGNPLKLTSNVLKDGRWVGARPGASVVPNAQ